MGRRPPTSRPRSARGSPKRRSPPEWGTRSSIWRRRSLKATRSASSPPPRPRVSTSSATRRARAGRGGHPPVSRHQGGHRPGHQGRLLLRLRVPAAGGRGRPAQAGRRDGEAHRRGAERFERREVEQGRGRGAVRRTSPTSWNSSAICPRTPPSASTRQGGFLDLCRGPHVPDSGQIGAVGLLSVAGAYWRGKSDNTMLTRIYGTAFPSKKELEEYLARLEMARQRDHRKLGRELGLFSFHDEGPGFPFFHPKGMRVINALLDYWRREHTAGRLRGDQDPHHARAHPVGALRPLGQLQGQHVLHPDRRRRFRGEAHELPGRHPHLQERPALLSRLPAALRRAGPGAPPRDVRRAAAVSSACGCSPRTTPTSTACPSRWRTRCWGSSSLIRRMYKTFGFEKVHVELSTRPEKSIGSDEMWADGRERPGRGSGARRVALRAQPG